MDFRRALGVAIKFDARLNAVIRSLFVRYYAGEHVSIPSQSDPTTRLNQPFSIFPGRDWKASVIVAFLSLFFFFFSLIENFFERERERDAKIDFSYLSDRCCCAWQFVRTER